MSKKEQKNNKANNETEPSSIKRPPKGVNPPEVRAYDPVTLQPNKVDKGKALKEWLNNAKNATSEGQDSVLIDPKQAIYSKKGEKKDGKKTTH